MSGNTCRLKLTPIPLPSLSPKPGVVGDLSRRLLAECDLSALPPLLDALAEEGRGDVATAVWKVLSDDLRTPVKGHYWLPQWNETARSLYAVLCEFLYDAAEVANYLYEQYTEPPRPTPTPYQDFPAAMVAAGAAVDALRILNGEPKTPPPADIEYGVAATAGRKGELIEVRVDDDRVLVTAPFDVFVGDRVPAGSDATPTGDVTDADYDVTH